jgi:porin
MSLPGKTMEIGGGYAPNFIGAPGSGHMLGVGVNWGEPNDGLFGSDLDDQYTFEVYCRFQVTKEFAITPDLQLLLNSALNPEDDSIWVYGIRARLAF